ncbi:MAG: TolC family protein [Candidatus Riflebacteria bacterium]|nr:TolC family protein [Candidatus Riflebacteria bacterium]
MHSQTISSASVSAGLTLSEVVCTTLRQNPEIMLQKREISSRFGAVVQASGSFQPVIQSSIVQDSSLQPLTNANRQLLDGRSFLPVKTTSYRLVYKKLMENGTVIAPGIEFSRNDTDIPAREPENRATVKFELSHPLARGRGTESLAFSTSQAAGFEYQSSFESLRQITNNALLSSISAYWNYLGAFRRLEILRSAEKRAEKLLSETEELILCDHQPAAEKSQVEANLASRQADAIAGANALVQNQRILGLSLGLSGEEIASLSFPSTDFPEDKVFEKIPSLTEDLLKSALMKRPELSALRLQEKAAKRLTAGSRNEELPKIDFNVAVGYSGLDENSGFTSFVTPFSKNVPGLNATVQVQTELPVQNLSARGIRQQREAAEKKINILIDQAKRHIGSGLSVAIANLEDSLKQVRLTRKAVMLFQKAVENEKARLAQGMSTIIDLITLEDRLTNASLANVQAQISFAQAIAAFQYESGVIYDENLQPSFSQNIPNNDSTKN